MTAIPAVAMARDGSVRNAAPLDRTVRVNDSQHAEFQGTNIYGLIPFTTPDGVEHLIGTISKKGQVWDFTAGQVLIDQAQWRSLLTAGSQAYAASVPGSGGDTYNACCVWTPPGGTYAGTPLLCLGGWYILSSPSASFDATYKHSYVIFTSDLVTWHVLVDDTLGTAGSNWNAEVMDLNPTQNFLYILRGDSAGTGGNAGLYTWDGTTITQQDTSAASKGKVVRDTFAYSLRNITSFRTVNAFTSAYTSLVQLQSCPSQVGTRTDAATVTSGSATVSDTSVIAGDNGKPVSGTGIPAGTFVGTVTAGASFLLSSSATSQVNVNATNNGTAVTIAGAKTPVGLHEGASGILANWIIAGQDNGVFLTDGAAANTSNKRFVPICISPTSGNSRTCGWRSQTTQVAGGVVIAANVYDPASNSNGLRQPSMQSVLLFIGPGGDVKVLDTGGYFGGVTVHNGRLYYGVSNTAHTSDFAGHQVDGVSLCSILVSDLHNRNPAPLVDAISYGTYTAGTSGEQGRIGGYPTLGYKQGKLLLTSSQAGTLTFSSWSPFQSELDLPTTVAFTAGQTQLIDLAPYLTGLLLGFRFSVNSVLSGSVSLSV